MNNFQRVGSHSNANVGQDFEALAIEFFSTAGLYLKRGHSVPVGVADSTKLHEFDLGSEEPKVIVECKSHKWTTGGNAPSAKMSVWNEAMYYFFIAPADYRKIFFVLRDENSSKNETLAQYYIRRYQHLIPPDVEIWEYDDATSDATLLDQTENVNVKR